MKKEKDKSKKKKKRKKKTKCTKVQLYFKRSSITTDKTTLTFTPSLIYSKTWIICAKIDN